MNALPIVAILAVLVIGFCILLALRELACWYFKINEMKEIFHSIEIYTRIIAGQKAKQEKKATDNDMKEKKGGFYNQ